MDALPSLYVKTKHGYAYVVEYNYEQSWWRGATSNLERYKVQLCDLPQHIDKDSVKELVASRFVTIEYQMRVAYRYGEGFIVRY